MKRYVILSIVFLILIGCAIPSLAEDFFQPINYGESGDNVQWLQEKLNQLGYTCAVDGYFDEDTLLALCTFQQINNLKVTGAGDAETITMLGGIYYVGRPERITITAYCACKICNGHYSDGDSSTTAIGLPVENMESYYNKYCAATRDVGLFGDYILVDGVLFRIVDRMGRKHGMNMDMFIPNHQECRKWGRQNRKVTIYSVYEPNKNINCNRY